MAKRLRQRKIKPRELKHEKEGSYIFFRIKYTEMGNVVPVTKEYQRKHNVERILDNPLTSNVDLFVLEIIDDG